MQPYFGLICELETAWSPSAWLMISNWMTKHQVFVGWRKRVVTPTLGTAISLEIAVVFSNLIREKKLLSPPL